MSIDDAMRCKYLNQILQRELEQTITEQVEQVAQTDRILTDNAALVYRSSVAATPTVPYI